MPSFSSFQPEIEAIKAQTVPWRDKLLQYAGKMGFEFYEAQLRELAKMLDMKGPLVGAEVGAGKTLLASVYLAFHTDRGATSVIVAPQGVHPQWKEEIARFTKRRVTIVESPGSLAAGINLIHVEAFRNGAKFSRPVDCVIADEAHFLANLSSQTEHFLSATAGVERRVALTATPVPNRVNELFYLLGWLSHKDWWSGKTSDTFPYTSNQGVDFEKAHCFGPVGIGVASPIGLSGLLNPFLITLTKSECRANQPPINVRFTPCSIQDSARVSWEKCFRRGTPSSIEMDFLTASERCSGKVQKAFDIIRGLQHIGHQVLVVSVRSFPLSQLESLCRASAWATSMISSVTSSDYQEQARKFTTGETTIMLMGIKCAQSYSFPNCSHVILIGCDFTYGMFHQALGRCHRLTSEKPVNVQVLYYPGTNETDVLDVVMAKAAQSALVLGERDIKLTHGGHLETQFRRAPDKELLPTKEIAKAAPIGVPIPF